MDFEDINVDGESNEISYESVGEFQTAKRSMEIEKHFIYREKGRNYIFA